MKLRSFLFVPGDRPDRMVKAESVGADALIIDLEDSVLPARKQQAREIVSEFLSRDRPATIFVRINPLSGHLVDEDLVAIAACRPYGIVLPKAEGAESLAELDRRLTVLGDKSIRILPIATETPLAIFTLGSYGGITKRLCGLTWGVEDISAAIGASGPRQDNGELTPVFETVRALTLFGAHAANVPAIEAIYPMLNDKEGLSGYAARGRRDGFSGMLAVHPSQVPIINAAFVPTNQEISWAQRVVELFEGNSEAGVLQLDGKMVDAPHLALARRLLKLNEIVP